MFPSPFSPIPAAAFAFPSLLAAFDTPIFTPPVILSLLVECILLALGCASLWVLSRPLVPRRPSPVIPGDGATRLQPAVLLRKQLGRLTVPRATAGALPRTASTTKIR